MAFLFNSNLSKLHADDKILNWEEIYVPSAMTTKSFSSTTSEVTTALVTNWANWTGWEDYAFVKIELRVTAMSYTKYSTTTPYTMVAFGDVVAFETELPTGGSSFVLDTSTQEAYIFLVFFERGRLNFKANGSIPASFYDGLGNEKDPYSQLVPNIIHKGCSNGTITFKISAYGAKLTA